MLVGKTMEQSLIEVAEEEELAELRKQQQLQQEIHNADLAEVERLEERNRRYRFVPPPPRVNHSVKLNSK